MEGKSNLQLGLWKFQKLDLNQSLSMMALVFQKDWEFLVIIAVNFSDKKSTWIIIFSRIFFLSIFSKSYGKLWSVSQDNFVEVKCSYFRDIHILYFLIPFVPDFDIVILHGQSSSPYFKPFLIFNKQVINFRIIDGMMGVIWDEFISKYFKYCQKVWKKSLPSFEILFSFLLQKLYKRVPVPRTQVSKKLGINPALRC